MDLLAKRPRATIKGVIMDQSFSAGVGNWVADEILFQSRVHPACPVGKLSDVAKEAVWREMKTVVDTAVGVNANHAKFPKGPSWTFRCTTGDDPEIDIDGDFLADWLFSWRWSKGKKDKNRKEKDETGGFRLVCPRSPPMTPSSRSIEPLTFNTSHWFTA